VLDTYLPPSATDEELAAAVDAAVTSTGARPRRTWGVMKAGMSALAGKTVDGKGRRARPRVVVALQPLPACCL
jgi:uncharacterized protein YqeY